ncbi:MAG: efflux RND transporter periplasmic adaptor subunit [Thermodesulfobacteriota bacterium]
MKRLPLKKIPLKIAVPAALLLMVVVAVWQWRSQQGQAALFRTAEVTRGELLVTIDATGVVQPEEVIDVGAQVAGRIVAFGQDAKGGPVDYGSRVTAGTVLARIDESLYGAEVAAAEAQVASARAGLQKAEADLFRAEQDWQRAQKLGPSEALSQSSYDSYHSAHKTAVAQVVVSKAAIRQADAALQRARRNLGYCTIVSPVDGVIIDRRVNIGQTVVASLNAPSLFLIAKDLTRIQVWVAVNEADIGRIHPGMPVHFTVDAFPDETFVGQVGKVRLNAAMNQNVVTYTVEIVTDNSNGRLLPYLTANVRFELERVADTLLVPNAALRWNPTDPEQVAPRFRDAAVKKEKGSRDGGQGGGRKKEAAAARAGTLWLVDGAQVRPLAVAVGQSDGQHTAVRGDGLREGLAVVTGLQPQASGDHKSAGGNPFAPSFARSGRQNQRQQ